MEQGKELSLTFPVSYNPIKIIIAYIGFIEWLKYIRNNLLDMCVANKSDLVIMPTKQLIFVAALETSPYWYSPM